MLTTFQHGLPGAVMVTVVTYRHFRHALDPEVVRYHVVAPPGAFVGAGFVLVGAHSSWVMNSQDG